MSINASFILLIVLVNISQYKLQNDTKNLKNKTIVEVNTTIKNRNSTEIIPKISNDHIINNTHTSQKHDLEIVELIKNVTNFGYETYTYQGRNMKNKPSYVNYLISLFIIAIFLTLVFLLYYLYRAVKDYKISQLMRSNISKNIAIKAMKKKNSGRYSSRFKFLKNLRKNSDCSNSSNDEDEISSLLNQSNSKKSDSSLIEEYQSKYTLTSLDIIEEADEVYSVSSKNLK